MYITGQVVDGKTFLFLSRFMLRMFESLLLFGLKEKFIHRDCNEPTPLKALHKHKNMFVSSLFASN